MNFHKSRCPHCGRLDFFDNVSDSVGYLTKFAIEEPQIAIIVSLSVVVFVFALSRLIFNG